MRLLAATLVSVLCAGPAAAQTFPARSGESGLLDVPDADVVGLGGGVLATELRVDQRQGSDVGFGPLPVYATAGLSPGLELGLSMRDGGQPGDPVPARMLFGAALKYRLVDGTRAFLSLATDAYVDRMNDREVGGGRLILSTAARLPYRLASFVGGEAGGARGVTYGAAFSVLAGRQTALVLEALGGPRGANFGIAVRRSTWRVPVALGVNYFPGDDGFRVSLGFAFGQRKKEAAPPGAVPAVTQPTETEPDEPQVARFSGDRPRFRMKMRMVDALSLDPRPLRHAAYAPPARGGPTLAGPVAAPAAPIARAAVPSLDDMAEQQLREYEALAESRERRVRATADQIDGREKAARDEAQRLEELARSLAAREQQVDARDKRIVVRGAPTQPQRDLLALEAQLGSQERSLSAQERSYGPALDAAEGRERDAASREQVEEQEASRLAAAASAASSRGVRIDLGRQALAARNRRLAASEAKLVAQGERVDALERQLRVRAERLGAWQRRLDARSERLDLLERRLDEPRAPAATPRPSGASVAPPKDKAVFVMVVKSPTSIVKERSSATPAGAAGGGIHPGVAVEKAVAAATVVTFPSTASQLSELDRETIDNIARLAATDGCELLIWARAKEPGLMPEAQRRAAEIKTRVLASGPLAERQVVSRITMRPGAQGIDVVVSALRETAKPAAAPAAPASGPSLEGGEAGKRQIREAVQAAQASIEACVADMMEQRRLPRAEGILKLTISPSGKVAKVRTEGDLAGGAVGECLSAASGGWTFPGADAEYVVDVPITVMRGGSGGGFR